MASIDAAEEGGGEGYFASVSDMMVGILFIFLLLLTVFALNLRDAEQEQKVKYEEYLQALESAKVALERAKAAEELAKEAELKAKHEAAIATAATIQNNRFRTLLLDAVAQLEKDLKDREASRSQLLLSLQSSLGARGVSVSIDPASGILRLPEDLLFKTGDSSIRPENLPRVQTLAEVLDDILPCYVAGDDSAKCGSDVTPILETVLVEGHTDRQAFRNTVVAPPPAAAVAAPAARTSLFSSAAPAPPVALAPPKLVVLNDSELRNDRLSTERALNVFKELKKAQPALESLRNAEKQSLLGFSGYGPRRPLPDALGSTQADYQKNRRIDLRFVLSARTSDELSRLQVQIRQALGSSK